MGAKSKSLKRSEYRKSLQQIQTQRQHEEPNGTTKKPLALPKKKFYRQRAHANPFSDHNLTYPASPAAMDWASHYPSFIRAASDGHDAAMGDDVTVADRGREKRNARVEVADIGCGFGGLIVALSPLMPTMLMIGMELRNQVTDYVVSRVAALRSQNPWPAAPVPAAQDEEKESSRSSSKTQKNPPPYHNISAVRSNTMKFLPNFFEKHQLSKIFLCFPDPHFKQRKHKARIVSAQLSAEYAFVVRPGGKVYTITDVEELHQWMVKHFVGSEAGDARELWETVGDGENEDDLCVRVMREETEEGKKVTRNNGKKFVAVFRRKEDPAWPDET